MSDSIDDIARRWAKVTPGPWQIQSNGDGKARIVANGHTVCKVWRHNGRANRAAIMNAPDDIRRLLGEIEILRANRPTPTP